MALRIEHLDTRATTFFRHVHGGVGVAEEPRGGIALGLGDGEALAGGHENLAIEQLNGSGERFGNPFGDLEGLLLFRNLLAKDHEFVPAEARHRIARTHRRTQPLGDSFEELITGGMTHAVVHQLEAIEIEEYHRRVAVNPTGATEGDFQTVHEEKTVGQGSERVVNGRMGKALSQLPAFCHILDLLNHVQRLSLVIAHARDVHGHPDLTTFGIEVPLLQPVGV